VSRAKPEEAGEILANAVIDLMRKVGMPNGLKAVGFGPQDVDKLVEGTLPQHRVTKLSPRPAAPEDLRRLFLDSMTLW
jgi:hydroxyacid-oxoacid transhydrogenase